MSTTSGNESERPDSERVASDPPAAVDPSADTTTSHEVPVRRVPKYQTFLLIGVAAGLIAAMILTFAFQRSPGEINASAGEIYFSPGQVFGFLLLICIPIGLVVFGLLAWILDLSSRSKTHTVRVDRVNVRVSEPEAETPSTGSSRGQAGPSSDQEDNL